VRRAPLTGEVEVKVERKKKIFIKKEKKRKKENLYIMSDPFYMSNRVQQEESIKKLWGVYPILKDKGRKLEIMNRVIQLDQTDAVAYYNRGVLLHSFFKHYDLALKDYNDAIKLNKYFYKAYCSRGTLYIDYLNESDKGIEDFTKTLEIFDKYEYAYYCRGFYLMHYYLRYEDALKDFERCGEFNKKKVDEYVKEIKKKKKGGMEKEKMNCKTKCKKNAKKQKYKNTRMLKYSIERKCINHIEKKTSLMDTKSERRKKQKLELMKYHKKKNFKRMEKIKRKRVEINKQVNKKIEKIKSKREEINKKKCYGDVCKKAHINIEGNYVQIYCDDNQPCKFTLHESCWKQYLRGVKTIKRIHCPTPDCKGIVNKINIYDKYGNTNTKIFNKIKKTKKKKKKLHTKKVYIKKKRGVYIKKKKNKKKKKKRYIKKEEHANKKFSHIDNIIKKTPNYKFYGVLHKKINKVCIIRYIEDPELNIVTKEQNVFDFKVIVDSSSMKEGVVVVFNILNNIGKQYTIYNVQKPQCW
jgi:tetratricopeptide (TPR) repeat protein